MMLTPGRKTDKVHQALESLARVAITDLGLYERLVKQSDEDDTHLSTKVRPGLVVEGGGIGPGLVALGLGRLAY